MQRGKTYSDVALYIPYEDGVMKGAYPPEKQRVWVWGEYELRYIEPPEETAGYHPLWINRHFLMQAEFKNGKLVVGDAAFSTLYIDVEYMDVRTLMRILELAKEGLPVCLKRRPKQPGHLKAETYDHLITELLALRNVSGNFNAVTDHPPLIQGDSLPGYWCRVEEDGTHLLFLAQPLSTDLTYPLYSGQSLMKQSVYRKLKFTIAGKTITQNVEFKPYQSVALKIAANGKVEQIDITFIPREPVVRPREAQKMYF